jgi:hypothetical protein
VAKTEAQEWFSRLDDPSDRCFLRLQEGVLNLLIHIGAAAKDDHPIKADRIGNGPVPDLYTMKLNTPSSCGPKKMDSRSFPGHMLDKEETLSHTALLLSFNLSPHPGDVR